jgi:hypothetical protein
MAGRISAVVNAIKGNPVRSALVGSGALAGGLGAYAGYRALNSGYEPSPLGTQTEVQQVVGTTSRGESRPPANDYRSQSYRSQDQVTRREVDGKIDKLERMKEELRLMKQADKLQRDAQFNKEYTEAIQQMR